VPARGRDSGTVARVINWLARSAMETFYPRSEAFPGLADMDVDGYLRRYARESAPLMWAGFVLGTLVFHLTPLFTVYLPLPAFALSAATRERHAQRLVSHPIYYVRQPVFLVKMVAGLLWGADPAVRAKLNLPAYPADPGTRRSA
jgi:hypothetical protein